MFLTSEPHDVIRIKCVFNDAVQLDCPLNKHKLQRNTIAFFYGLQQNGLLQIILLAFHLTS